MSLIDDLVNPWHIAAVGNIGKGNGDRFAPYSRNPGLRCKLSADPQLTKKGVLEEDLILPAPPLDQFQRSLSYEWADYQTIGSGTHSRPTGMALQTVQFDTILIGDDYPWAFYNPLRVRGWDSTEQGRQLGNVLRKGTPIRLVVEQAGYNVTPTDATGRPTSPFPEATAYDYGSKPVLSMLATLRAVTLTMKNGEPECWYVNVSFTEHHEATVDSQTKKKAAGGTKGATTSTKGGAGSSKLPLSIPLGSFAATPKPSANTLHDLATVYYGSAAKWTVIKAANSWLGNVTADHDLGDWNTSELKAAGKANRRLTLPVSGG